MKATMKLRHPKSVISVPLTKQHSFSHWKKQSFCSILLVAQKIHTPPLKVLERKVISKEEKHLHIVCKEGREAQYSEN